MANEVAYKIVVDTSKAVQEIKDLEKEIARLKKELSNTKEGALGFDTLSAALEGLQKKYDSLIQGAVKAGDIITESANESSEALKGVNDEASKTEKGLKNLGAEAKKVDVATPFKNYVKIGSAVTASFAAAQSVFAVFGADTKKIAEAAAKAQSLLTVAIAARETAEAIGAATTVTATLATNLKTAADNTQIAVLKKLYTVLANNPYAIVAAGVGLLVTAFIALTSSTDEAAEAQKKFQESIDTDVAKETTNLNLLVATVNDTTQSIKTREAALDELQKKFPAYFENLKEEDILSGRVKIATDELTAAIVAQAQARALEQRIAERGVKLLDLERQLAKATEERARAERNLKDAQGVIIAGGSTTGGFTATGDLRNQVQDKYNAALSKENEIKNQLNDINVANAIDAQKILDLQKQSVATLSVETAEKEQNNKATEEQIALAKLLEEALNDQLATLEQTAEIFKKLSEAGGFQIAEPEALKRIKELKSNIQGLIPPDLKDKFKSIGLDIAIENGTYKIKEFGNELKNIQDVFGLFVEGIRKELGERVFSQSIEDFAKTSTRIIKDTADLLQQGLISREAFEATEKLIQQYKDLNRIVTELPPGVRKVFTEGKINEYLDITRQIAIATGQIKFERVNGEIIEIKNSTVDLAKETERLTKFQEDSIKSLIVLYTETFKIKEGDRKLSVEQFQQEINNLEALGKLTEDDAAKLRARVSDTNADLKKLIKEVAEAQVKALNSTVQNIIAEENQVRAFLFRIQQERKEALVIQGEAQKNLFLNNLEDIYKITQSENQIVIDGKKSQEEQLVQLQEQFSAKQISLSEFTEEERLKILKFYLGKQKEILTAEQLARKEQADKFIEGLQQIQGVLNSLGQTTTAYFNNQFDMLEKRYKRITDGIVGDSKRSAELRIEAEKAYNAERAKLEKQAAKRSLQIALAQSIANSAEAIAKTYAVYGGTPIAVGAAAAVAGLNLVQTGIIASQLANIDSYRRGGKIKMAGGGLVQGPAHEYGGVKFQGGGIELEGNEAVINRFSTVNYMGLLDQINQAGGGKPIGNFDDSRIVEAIAKQRNTPIRAYVVESDITSKQTTARRLEQLASF